VAKGHVSKWHRHLSEAHLSHSLTPRSSSSIDRTKAAFETHPHHPYATPMIIIRYRERERNFEDKGIHEAHETQDMSINF